jgi:pimeloyl-ACP methyl ester carboxylesterase
MREIRIKLKGKEYRYFYFGRGKKTLLILHGLAGGKETMLRYSRSFSKRYRCLIPDPPGNNGLPLYGYGLSDLAGYIQELLGHLKIKEFGMIGFSFGGWIGLDLISRYSRKGVKIPSVMLCTPIRGDASPFARGFIRFVYSVPSPILYPLLRSRVPYIFGDITGLRMPRLSIETFALADRQMLKNSVPGFDIELGPTNGSPILFLYGDKDDYVSRDAASDIRSLKRPGVKVVVVKGGGHFGTAYGEREKKRQADMFLREHL